MLSYPSLFRTVGALLVLRLAIVSAQQYKGHNVTRMWYKCPEDYMRIGNGCYYLSDKKATWREAQFACQDHGGGYLAKLDKGWKDRSVKRFLNRPKRARLERWFGTVYDFGRNTWIWGVGGEKLHYQGFSRRKPNDNYSWRCGVLDPLLYFRWSTRSCLEKKAYICQTPIKLLMFDGKKTMAISLRKGKHRTHRRNQLKRPSADIETNQIT